MLNQLSILQKIWLIIAMAALAFACVVGSSMLFTMKSNTGLALVKDKMYDISMLASQIKVEFKSVDEFFTQAVTLSDPDLLNNAKERSSYLSKLIQQVTQIDPSYNELIKSNQVLTTYTQLSSRIASSFVDGTVDFNTVGKDIERKTELFNQLSKEFEAFDQHAHEAFEHELNDISDNMQSALTTTTTIGVLLVLLIAVTGHFIGRSIVVVANSLVRSLHELATGTGSLSVRLTINSNDELGRVAEEFNAFISLLQNSFGDITQLIEPLRDSAQNLRQGMDSLNQMTDHQAEEVQQVAKAMLEMQNSVTEISESAHQASDRAENAKSVADTGLAKANKSVSHSRSLTEQMETAGQVIHKLSEQTGQVTDILKNINDIADQTNLLALNAAIEAARAGQHGKGFAVVAEEVRHLSSKTASSVSNIRNVLNELVKNIDSTVSIVGDAIQTASESAQLTTDAGGSITSINLEIDEINTLNTQIAAATRQQSTVAAMIVSNTEKMTSSFTQAQGLLKDVESISGELNNLSQKLSSVSSKFKD
ncbi:MAG: methyl-accepting chemotaxis protein [Idiomarina sp.]